MPNIVKKKLKEFEKNILESENYNKQFWLTLRDDFEKFIKDNALTIDDLQEFTMSGAGELLYMVCSGLELEE